MVKYIMSGIASINKTALNFNKIIGNKKLTIKR